MTTSKFNTVVIAAIAAVFSFVFGVNNASAQSLTQSELDSLNVLNLRTIQASISDKTHKDFKWVSEGQKTSNKIEVTNRTGILIGAEGGYNFNHGYEAGLKIGYQGAFGLRQFAPEAAAYAGQVKVDGQSYTTWKLVLTLNSVAMLSNSLQAQPLVISILQSIRALCSTTSKETITNIPTPLQQA